MTLVLRQQRERLVCGKWQRRARIFEANLDYSSFLKLKDKLIKLIDEETDSLRFYYLGNNWKKRIEHVGAKETYDSEGVLIV